MNLDPNSNAGTFPSGDHRGVQAEYGLTKREYFASLAMQGVLSGYYANPNINPSCICRKEEIVPQISTILDWTDELLKQLSQNS